MSEGNVLLIVVAIAAWTNGIYFGLILSGFVKPRPDAGKGNADGKR